MVRLTPLVLGWLVLVSVNREACCGIIVGFDFTTSAAPSTLDPNVTSTDFTAGSGLLSATFVPNATARKWNSNSAALALSHSELWTFTVTPDAGQQLNLTSISFNEWHRATETHHGPENFQVLVNGSLVSPPPPPEVASTATSSPGTTHTFLFNLPGLINPAMIQIIAWNAHDASSN